jgi:DNA-directed RNA polymerase subunit RPC12/RpoP
MTATTARPWLSRILTLLVGVSLLALRVFAQGTEPQLVLSNSRLFGYGGSGEIQGSFRLRVSGPEDLSRVVFEIDGQSMGEVTQPPWQLQYITDNFPSGEHTLTATGYTATGQELYSNEIRTRFLSSQQAGQATTRVVVVLLGGILGLMVLSALLSSVLFRRRTRASLPGTPRNYGLAGGAICSRCGRPFARHVLSPHLLGGKLERCPYCGKWGFVRAASPAELAAAEAAESGRSAGTEQPATQSGTEQLRRDVEDSRFEDQ